MTDKAMFGRCPCAELIHIHIPVLISKTKPGPSGCVTVTSGVEMKTLPVNSHGIPQSHVKQLYSLDSPTQPDGRRPFRFEADRRVRGQQLPL